MVLELGPTARRATEGDRRSTAPRFLSQVPRWRTARGVVIPVWMRCARGGAHSWNSSATVKSRSSGLELQVLVRSRVRVSSDQAETRFRYPGPDAIEEAELPDGGGHDLLVHELLDLHEDCLAFLRVRLRRLLLEEP